MFAISPVHTIIVNVIDQLVGPAKSALYALCPSENMCRVLPWPSDADTIANHVRDFVQAVHNTRQGR